MRLDWGKGQRAIDGHSYAGYGAFMKYVVLSVVISVALSGCALVPAGLQKSSAKVDVTTPIVGNDGSVQTRPQSRPADAPVVDTSGSVNDAVPVAASGDLGKTVASLGSPAEPGLWLKTPLVTAGQSGKISYKGKTIDVNLIPIDGPKTAGSRLSLQGFQALGAPLTELVEVTVAL